MPYLKEDNIKIEFQEDNGEVELRPYRANRYIGEYYGSQEKATKELFDKEIITYDIVAKVISLTPTVVKNIINKEIKNPNSNARRRIEIFFNKDFYKELGRYNDRFCANCTKRKKCGQAYWVDVISCPSFRLSKSKK